MAPGYRSANPTEGWIHGANPAGILLPGSRTMQSPHPTPGPSRYGTHGHISPHPYACSAPLPGPPFGCTPHAVPAEPLRSPPRDRRCLKAPPSTPTLGGWGKHSTAAKAEQKRGSPPPPRRAAKPQPPTQAGQHREPCSPFPQATA